MQKRTRASQAVKLRRSIFCKIHSWKDANHFDSLSRAKATNRTESLEIRLNTHLSKFHIQSYQTEKSLARKETQEYSPNKKTGKHRTDRQKKTELNSCTDPEQRKKNVTYESEIRRSSSKWKRVLQKPPGPKRKPESGSSTSSRMVAGEGVRVRRSVPIARWNLDKETGIHGESRETKRERSRTTLMEMVEVEVEVVVVFMILMPHSSPSLPPFSLRVESRNLFSLLSVSISLFLSVSLSSLCWVFFWFWSKWSFSLLLAGGGPERAVSLQKMFNFRFAPWTLVSLSLAPARHDTFGPLKFQTLPWNQFYEAKPTSPTQPIFSLSPSLSTAFRLKPPM